MAKKISVGIVGGGIGKQHLDGFRALPDVFAVNGFCDLSETQRARYRGEFSIPFVTDAFDALCAKPDIDVIDICTPPFLHFSQIRQALLAGKNVICEKPLVASLSEIDQLAKISEEVNRHILPVYQYRYGHGLQKLLYLKDLGILGKPYLASIEVAWRRGADYFAVPWRGKMSTHLGGCLLDQSIHMHDIAELVMGKAVAVTAQTRTLVNPVETEDCAGIVMETETGALAIEAVTLGAASEKTRLKFCFENMTVISDHDQPYRPQDEPWQFVPSNTHVAVAMEKALENFKPGLAGYAGLFFDYYTAVTTGKELPVTLADAHRSVGLVSAMYFSAQHGVRVSLPLLPDHLYYQGWAESGGQQRLSA